jgi:zinc finger BED domain-containing protein 5/7/8/9
MDRFVIRKDAREKKDKPDEENDDKAIISKVKKRKYQDEYLQYGFIASENDPSLPFCLICAKSFSNESMNPSKLIRHLEANHREQKNNPIGYFEKLRSNLQSQAKKFKKYVTTSDQAQIASYRIAQLLAKKKKPHAEAEEIVLPALKIAAECMLTNDAVEKFKNIPLSSKTIARRIEDLSDDIELQLNECFNDPSRKWAIQLDESIDISNKAQLLSFLRFVRGEMIVSEYFFCQELKQTITGKDIFEMVDANVKKNNLKWENCVSVCTDGAPTMQGRKKGFVSHVVKKNQSVKIVHCMIHREVLVSKALPSILKDTLNEVVSVVNYIKANALRSRIFAALCEAMDSDYKTLLYHTEVRWLSKGKVLNRFLFMKVEIVLFIDTEEVDFSFLKEDIWWLRVSFLSDIFDKLNDLNLKLQGAQENFITISSKLKGFEEKLKLWSLKVSKSIFGSFPAVDSIPSKIQIKEEIGDTLKSLSESFLKYFPNLNVTEMEWVVNPFAECEAINLEEELDENLIDLRNDLVFKRIFAEKELSEFWISLNNKFPRLSSKAIELLLPFGSSYLCEQGFSVLTEMKSKKRERLQMIDKEMRVCLSKIEPRINHICAEKQSQISH